MIGNPQFPMNPVLPTDMKLERESYTNLMAWAIHMQNAQPVPPWSVGISDGKVEWLFAKIVTDNGDGTYDADEVIWDEASPSAWVRKSGGHDFSGASEFPYLYELTSQTGVAANTIVIAFRTIDDSGGQDQWFFQANLNTYTGPFAVSQATSTSVTIGDGRSATQKDIITFNQADNSLTTLEKTASETVASVTADKIIGYKIHRDTGTTWTAAAYSTALASWPGEGAKEKEYLFVPLAIVLTDGGTISSIRQLQYGNIFVEPRHILKDFKVTYENNNMYVEAGTVQIGGTTQAVTGTNVALSSATDVWVQATFTRSTNAWAITSTLQTGSIGTKWADSSGVITWKIPIASVDANGQAQVDREGQVNLYEEQGMVRVIATTGSDAPQMLRDKLPDDPAEAYDSVTDLLVEFDDVTAAGNTTLKAFIRMDQLNGWSTDGLATHVLAQDGSAGMYWQSGVL